jgi:hypothetical protein
VFQPDIRAGCSKSLYNLELGHEASSPDLSSSPLAHQEDESMSGTEETNCRADTPGSERSTPEEGRGFRREYTTSLFSYTHVLVSARLSPRLQIMQMCSF